MVEASESDSIHDIVFHVSDYSELIEFECLIKRMALIYRLMTTFM